MAYSLITEDLTDRSEVEREVLEFIEDHPELHRNIPLQGLGPIICNTARRFRSYLKHWGVVEFTGRRKNLLLSDFPCIRTTGVGRPNAVFALPLSPRKAVLGFKTLETQQIYLGGMSRGELLSRINESSFAQTTRRIYALERAISLCSSVECFPQREERGDRFFGVLVPSGRGSKGSWLWKRRPVRPDGAGLGSGWGRK